MRKVMVILCLVFGLIPAGCVPKRGTEPVLLVDFKPDTTVRYRMLSERNIAINIDTPSKPQAKDKAHTMAEKLEMVIAYRVIKADPFGLTTVEALCESAKVTRDSLTGSSRRDTAAADAMESLAGKTFTLQLSPAGRIVDHSDMDRIVSRLGQKAFASEDPSKGRIKNPDMISDFIAMQLFMWDAVSSMGKPGSGLNTGKSWKAVQLMPLPFALVVAKDTTFTLTDVQQTPKGKRAVIGSTYALGAKPSDDWPEPYTGSFHTRGSLFSVLAGYQFKSIEGRGTLVFDMDNGRIESDDQQYRLEVGAIFILPLGDSKPYITIDQKTHIELIRNDF